MLSLSANSRRLSFSEKRKNRFQYHHDLHHHHTAFHLADDKKYPDEAAVEEGEGGLRVVRQVVPLPAEEVVVFIDPEVHQAEQLTTEEVADEEEKQDRVVFVAKTSKREKTTTLPIVVGGVVGVVFLLLSLLIVLCLRFIRLKSPNFSQEIAHYCKIDRNKSEQEAERGGLPCQVQDGDWGARDDGGKAHL